MWIEYFIKKPDYIEYQDTNIYTYNLLDFKQQTKIQNVHHNWNLGNI